MILAPPPAGPLFSLDMECALEILPEIKSEIKAEDFVAAQQQQLQQQQQQLSLTVSSTTPQPQQNCQWVSPRGSVRLWECCKKVQENPSQVRY